MKFAIKNEGFVTQFSLSVNLPENTHTETEENAKLSITPSLQRKDNALEHEFGVTLKVEIETARFNLELSHFFIIEFAKTPTEDQQASNGLRKRLINALYPYSRALIISTLANGGYGTINLPLLVIE